MKLFPRFRRAPAETKASRAAPLIAWWDMARPRWSARDVKSLSREGFCRNPLVYRAVRLIAESSGSVPLLLHDGAVEVTQHPLTDLLARPNARQTGAEFTELVATHLLIAGNAYIEAVSVEGEVKELYALRPDRISMVPGRDGWPSAYLYKVGEREVRFSQDGASPPILHLTLPQPFDDHFGYAPLEAAATAIDIHNASAAWTKALLDNAARPSGALVYSGSGHLSEEQFARLKSELEDNFSGASNAGRPLLLEGGLDWKAMSLSPKDMDFIEAKNASARDIALAFGVPPMLLGIPGDNTYSTFQEANRAFWRQTILPLVSRTAQALADWLSPADGQRLRLIPDPDAIDAALR
jgi:HK97 family phage portal protein